MVKTEGVRKEKEGMFMAIVIKTNKSYASYDKDALKEFCFKERKKHNL